MGGPSSAGLLLFNLAANVTVSGGISDGGGTLTLTQSGTGTTTLTGSNSYSGATTINAGTLQIGNGTTAGSLAPAPSSRQRLVVPGLRPAGQRLPLYRRQPARPAGAGNLVQDGAGSTVVLTNSSSNFRRDDADRQRRHAAVQQPVRRLANGPVVDNGDAGRQHSGLPLRRHASPGPAP